MQRVQPMVNEAVPDRTYGNVVEFNQHEAISGGHTDVSGDAEEERLLMANGEHPTREEIDAKLETVQERLYRRLDRIEGKLDVRPTFLQMTAMIFVGIGLAVAVIAYASDRFDGGLAASSLLDQVTEEQKKRDAAQDKKLEQILKAVENIRDQPQGSAPQVQN